MILTLQGASTDMLYSSILMVKTRDRRANTKTRNSKKRGSRGRSPLEVGLGGRRGAAEGAAEGTPRGRRGAADGGGALVTVLQLFFIVKN